MVFAQKQLYFGSLLLKIALLTSTSCCRSTCGRGGLGKFEGKEGALLEAPYQFERDLSRFRGRYGLCCPEYIEGGIVQFVQFTKIAVTRELDVGNVLKLASRCPVGCQTTT